MDEELSYAEMLEIPVETVTVQRRERKQKYPDEPDLSEQLVKEVNDRMEEAGDPAYAESKTIEREKKPRAKHEKRARRIIIGEFVAVCALCAAIFITNLFMPTSAINTFVRGLFGGKTATADTRSYADFTLTPVVSEFADVTLDVSETGMISFKGDCAVYSPCNGTLSAVNGNKDAGYTVEIKHSEKFSTVISGLDEVYISEGGVVYHNVPLARSNGGSEVRVSFFSGESVLTCFTLNGIGLAWS